MAEQHEAGNKGLPDVIAAGYHVRPLPSERFFADFPELSHLKAGVSGPEDVRALVRANARRRVKFIKVMATQRAGTVDADFRQRALTDSELVAAVSEARRNGLNVAAHAHTDDGVRAAVSVGAKTIEHGTEASVPTLRMMRTQRACLVPTLSFWADMASPGGEYDHPVLAHRARTMLPLAKLMVARARREAVMIAAGSDMRYDRTSSFSIADELMLMQDSGLSTFEALRAGTSSAAACLGVGARTGSLRAGMEADLLIVGGNPLKNLAQLKRPRLVINDGTIVEH